MGIILGQHDGHYLIDRSETHVCLVGPNRSGKGTSVVIPTLLTIPGSVLVLDVKGELWDATAHARQQESYTMRFDPTTRWGLRINPLMAVRKGDHEIADMQQVITILTDPAGLAGAGKSMEHPHWLGTANGFGVGLGLHLLYSATLREKSIGGMLRYVSQPGRHAKAMFTTMQRTKHHGTHTHAMVARVAQSMLNRRESDWNGIISTVERMLNLWYDPVLDEATSGADCGLAALQYADKPMSLYLTIPADHLSRLGPCMRLILHQLLHTLVHGMPGKAPWPLTIILDEFARLESMHFLSRLVSYLPGYKIRILFVLQGLSQLDHWYGVHNDFVNNCPTKVIYQCNDEAEARRIVAWCGERTRLEARQTVSRTQRWWGQARHSTTTVPVQEPLVRVQDVMGLAPEQALIFQGGEYPIWATKNRYYAETYFRERVAPPPTPGYQDVPRGQQCVWSS